MIILLVFATKLQRGGLNRAKVAVEGNTGVARRPAFARFAASAILPASAVSDRQAGPRPEFSSRVATRPSAYPPFPSTHNRMARHLWRGAARAIRPGGLKTDLASDGASARATLARGRVMPARVPHGQQNDHRRLPPRRNAGGGATRQRELQEFHFESASKKQLRGNIYLAKVTRVEPSLQAAFVEYGGNRHGFLAFSEIHPDYYQIPHRDRVALLEEELRAHREEEDEGFLSRRRSRRHRRGSERRRPSDDERVSGEVLSDDERAAGSEAQAVEFTENHVSHVDEGALPVASEGDAEAALTPVDFVAVEGDGRGGARGLCSVAREEPAQEAPAQEAHPLETVQVEASAPEAAPAPHDAPAQIEAVARESHELAHDPEGFCRRRGRRRGRRA